MVPIFDYGSRRVSISLTQTSFNPVPIAYY